MRKGGVTSTVRGPTALFAFPLFCRTPFQHCIVIAATLGPAAGSTWKRRPPPLGCPRPPHSANNFQCSFACYHLWCVCEAQPVMLLGPSASQAHNHTDTRCPLQKHRPPLYTFFTHFPRLANRHCGQGGAFSAQAPSQVRVKCSLPLGGCPPTALAVLLRATAGVEVRLRPDRGLPECRLFVVGCRPHRSPSNLLQAFGRGEVWSGRERHGQADVRAGW